METIKRIANLMVVFGLVNICVHLYHKVISYVFGADLLFYNLVYVLLGALGIWIFYRLDMERE